MRAHAGLKRILILDDDVDFRELIMIYLGSMFKGVKLVEYDPIAQGEPGKDFDWSQYDVLLLDYYLRDLNLTGLDIFQANCKNGSFPATIILTATGSEEIAVRSLKAGVYDYLRKEQLGKQKLQQSILSAFERHQSRRKELGKQNNAFNKAMFYQKLEQASKQSEKRILLLLELDNHTELEESLGIIFRDNIVQHIAKQSFEIFRRDEYNPSTTRFSDAAVALLIDDPGAEKILSSKLEELCNHLEKKPYQFEDKEFGFTVSMGVLALATAQGTVEEIIQQVHSACKIASATKANKSYTHHSSDQAGLTQQAPEASPAPAPQPKAPAARKKAPASRPALAVTHTKPAAKPSPPPSQKNEIKLAEAELHEAALKIKNAFEEKRVVPTFQPIIPLSDTGEGEERELHSVSLQLLGSDGKIMEAEDIYAQTNTPAFRQYIDRWMIREAIRRIVNSEMRYIFVIELSQASLDDASLFNWLRKLLAGFEAKAPGKLIVLELKASVFANREKQACALISYLTKAHDFRFALSDFDKYDAVNRLSSKASFTLVRIDHKQIRQLAKKPVKKGKLSALQRLKDLGVSVIADKIEDATTLTEVISIGADYALGDFIGQPTQQLGELTNVESLEVV